MKEKIQHAISLAATEIFRQLEHIPHDRLHSISIIYKDNVVEVENGKRVNRGPAIVAHAKVTAYASTIIPIYPKI